MWAGCSRRGRVHCTTIERWRCQWSFHFPHRKSSFTIVIVVLYPALTLSSSTPRKTLIPGPCTSDLAIMDMYQDNWAVKSWIDAVHYAEGSEAPSGVSDADSVHLFSRRSCGDYSLPSSACDPAFDIHVSHPGTTWVTDLPLTSYDSDESGTSSSTSDDAQYISIPCDDLWHRPPEVPNLKPAAADIGSYPKSCSSDVRQALAQQDFLLNLFHAELRRIVPSGDRSGYDADWIEEVDPELVLSPRGVYERLCWESAVSDKSTVCQLTKPLADVPIGFGDIYMTF